MDRAEAHFDFLGLRLAVSGCLEMVEAVRLDFAWFEDPLFAGADLTVEVSPGKPRLDRFGDMPAAFCTTRNVVYQRDGRTIVDYFGRALVVFDRIRGEVLVEGDEPHLVHEAIYLFMLSRVGEHLDARGLVRLHAMALAGNQGAVAVLLPAGGGKSTLALRALREPDVLLFSDDSPLLDRDGRLHAFPLRLGVNAAAAAELPPAHVRRVERYEFPAKYVVALDAFRARIATQPQRLAHIVLGQRSLGRDARLAAVPRRSALAPLFRDGVVGLGTAQAAEYMLQRGWRDVLGKAGVASRRAGICGRALVGAQTWTLRLGSDGERNWAALAELLN